MGCVQPNLVAAVLLLAIATIGIDGAAADESLVITTQPGREIAARIITQPLPDVRLSLNARSRHTTGQTIRLGVAMPGVVAGPVTLAGAYAELANPMTGTAAGDRWFVPGRITVDTSLVPSSRIGAAVGRIPWADGFAWYVSDTLTVGATLRALVDRERYRVHGELLSAFSYPVPAPDEGDPGDRSWFADAVVAEPIAHALVRSVGSAGPVRIGIGSMASVPRLTMPGMLVRSAGDFRSGRWRLAGAGAMTTPGFQDTRGRRPGDQARWGVSLRYGGLRLSAAVEHDRSYTGSNDAYRAVGFVPGALSLHRGRSAARVTARPSVRGAGVRSVGADGHLDLDRSAWRLRAHARIVLPGERVELAPSVTWRSDRLADFRLRSVAVVDGRLMDRFVPGSSLRVSLIMEYTGATEEDRGVASTLEITFRASQRRSGPVSPQDASASSAVTVLDPFPDIDHFSLEVEAEPAFDFATDVFDDGADFGGGR